MEKSMLPPTLITQAQKAWLERERERTGSAYAVIVRELIQKQIERRKRSDN